jgi:hypothetical protein
MVWVGCKFVNLKIRQLSAETTHDFIEWCGLVEGHQSSEKLMFDTKLNLQDLYYDFIEHYPDYGPKAKMTISRTRFYRWIMSYSKFVSNIPYKDGRDMNGRWIIIHSPKKSEVKQTKLSV